MRLALFVPPGPFEISAFAGFVAFFALMGFLIDTPSRRLFEGTRAQYTAALGINAALFMGPLLLWAVPVMRETGPAPAAALLFVAIAVAFAYVLLRIARLLPGIGSTMLALDRARRQQRLGGQA